MRLLVCCNDEHGHFDHRAIALSIGAIDFQAKNWERPPRFVEGSGWLRLAGKKWTWSRSKEYVGNWCWNSYLLEPRGPRTATWYLADFVIWLRGRGLYLVDCGPSEFFDWFNDPQADLPKSVIHQMIREALDDRAT